MRIHRSCHGEHASLMLQIILHAVCSEFTFDGPSRAAHTGALRTAALNHETGNDPVKDQAVIKAALYQLDEVLYCDRRGFFI